jgi:hypothetical protein
MFAKPYRLFPALILIFTASYGAFSTRAFDPKDTATPKGPPSEARTAVTITTLRRTHVENRDHAELLALQRRAFADARSNARVEMTMARERLREIRFEHASPSKEK